METLHPLMSKPLTWVLKQMKEDFRVSKAKITTLTRKQKTHCPIDTILSTTQEDKTNKRAPVRLPEILNKMLPITETSQQNQGELRRAV